MALGLAAHCHLQLDANGWSNDQRNRQDSVDLAHRALQAAGDNPNALGYVAHVRGYFEPDWERGWPMRTNG
jgi:hypothetical protein